MCPPEVSKHKVYLRRNWRKKYMTTYGELKKVVHNAKKNNEITEVKNYLD